MFLVTVLPHMIMVMKMIHLYLHKKSYLRTNYIESNIEDIDLKNQFRIKNLPDRLSIREAASKIYVDNKFNDSSIKKNTDHVKRSR